MTTFVTALSSCVAQRVSAKIDISREFGFCPFLAETLQSRRLAGRSGKIFEGLPALSTLNNLLLLRQLMMETRPKRTLEVGLAFGGSALALAASHRDLGHDPDLEHVAIDPFQESVWDSAGLLAVERAGLAGHLDHRSAPSAVELPKLMARPERFGLVYIDGSHLFEDVFIDAYYLIRLLDHGGIVAFDDSSDSNVRKVLRFIRANLKSGLEEMDLSTYRSGAASKTFYRLSRRIGRIQMTAFRRVGPVEREWNAPFHDF